MIAKKGDVMGVIMSRDFCGFWGVCIGFNMFQRSLAVWVEISCKLLIVSIAHGSEFRNCQTTSLQQAEVGLFKSPSGAIKDVSLLIIRRSEFQSNINKLKWSGFLVPHFQGLGLPGLPLLPLHSSADQPTQPPPSARMSCKDGR